MGIFNDALKKRLRKFAHHAATATLYFNEEAYVHGDIHPVNSILFQEEYRFFFCYRLYSGRGFAYFSITFDGLEIATSCLNFNPVR